MKKAIVLIFIFCSTLTLSGQDKIILKNKEVLTVKIVEQTERSVKYQMLDYTDGPLIILKTGKIERIEYYNGTIDLVGNQNPRKYRPIGVGAGVTYFFYYNSFDFPLNFDYFITPQIDLQLNFGSMLGHPYMSFGSKFHYNSNKSEWKFTPFVGLLFGVESSGGFSQIPMGAHYIGKKGLSISLSANMLVHFNNDSTYYYNNQSDTFLELIIGYKIKR